MARLRHLVVVLPGIGGSVLTGTDPADSAAFEPTFGGLTRIVFSPGRLDISQDWTPTGLVSSLAVLPPLLTLPGYQRVAQRRGAVTDLQARTFASLFYHRLHDTGAIVRAFDDARLSVTARWPDQATPHLFTRAESV